MRSSSLLLLAFTCIALGVAQRLPTLTEPSSVQDVVNVESSAVQRQFPTAKLFEVSVFNVKPSDIANGKIDATSVQSSFYVGEKDRYVKAMQETTSQPIETRTLVLEKKAENRPCKKPYPTPQSVVCDDGLNEFQEEPQAVPAAKLSGDRLADAISKLSLSPSVTVNVTLTTAGRLLQTLKQDSKVSDASLRTRLAKLSPEQSIISITPVGGEAKLRDSTTYLDADNFDVIARASRSTKHMPPSRKP